MSESGSVFRHGTLRWTYALRSKKSLCLPQCIPNRSDKVPPLCDPDPLLIMDRLQNRPPPPSETQLILHTELRSALRGERQHFDEHTWYDMSTFMPCDSLKVIRSNVDFSFCVSVSFKECHWISMSITTKPSGFILKMYIYYDCEYTEPQRKRTAAKFCPVQYFCWSSNEQDLGFIRVISLTCKRNFTHLSLLSVWILLFFF